MNARFYWPLLVAFFLPLVCIGQSDVDYTTLWREEVTRLPRMSVRQVLTDPESPLGKKFLFSGELIRAEMSDTAKSMILVEIQPPKRNQNSLEFFTTLPSQYEGPEIPVRFEEWHANKSKTPDGRQQIRSLASLPDLISPQTSQRFLVVGVVRQFRDTFKPYIELVDFRREVGVSQPQANSTPQVVPAQITRARIQGVPSPDNSFQAILAGIPDSTLYVERLLTINRDYETVLAALEAVFKEQKEKGVTISKETGVVTTDLTQHGIVFIMQCKYILHVTKTDNHSSQVRYRVMRPSLSLPDYDDNGKLIRLLPQPHCDYHDEKFEKALKKKLSGAVVNSSTVTAPKP